MIRHALGLALLLAAAAPAAAATYSAKPLTPAADRVIARDLVWRCGPAACQAATGESRPAVICQALVKRVGPLERFAVDGRAFAPAELDRCNAAAGDASLQQLARAR